MDLEVINNRLINFQFITDYRGYFVKNQRIFDIHPGFKSPQGSDIFVSGIPLDALEDELIPFFATIGKVVRFKFTLFHNSLNHRGFATITYLLPETADQAVNILRWMPFKGVELTIEKITDNCRIFIGGIPECKTKDQVWQELLRVGVEGIIDVIMYRSYRDRSLNRGYVFVEFQNYQQAAEMRVLYKNLHLWNERMSVDWSEPIPVVDSFIMSKVKKLFIRNIEVTISKNNFSYLIRNIIGNMELEKVYKFKDYAFLHFKSRRDAQIAFELLKGYFKNTFVEVYWATPQEYAPNKKRNSCTSSSSTEIHEPASHRSDFANSDFDRSTYNKIMNSSTVDPYDDRVTEIMKLLTLE